MKKFIMVLVCLACFCYGAFDEDSYLLEALDYEAQSKFDKARDAYLVLYEETRKIEYFKEAILLSSMLNNPSATLDFLNEYIAEGGTKDLTIHKIFLDCYLKLGLSDKAFEELQIISKMEDSPLIDDIMGSLYATKGDYKNALLHLKKAYERTKSADVVQKIISIELAQARNKEALLILDSHIEQYGCSLNFCKFSIDVYAKFSRIEKIQSILEKTFNENPTIENAHNLILIYAHQKKFKQASDIAAQFPFNGHLLLELYVAQKDYPNASLQAKYIYDENHNPFFLALAQLYAFEALSNKQDKSKIHTIIDNLKTAINLMQKSHKDTTKDSHIDASLQNSQNSDLGFFLNFLGYLMIDYEVDVKKGIWHVKKALEISPLNPAYLDSLAWGYYKLKDCTNAKLTFALISADEIEKEQELKEHKMSIEKCSIQ